MIIRINNDNLGRTLHNTLHQRLSTFCMQYTPEFPSEPVVSFWLQRLYNSDESIHILVDMDDNYQITAHALIEQQTLHNRTIILCHQVQDDHKGMVFLDAVMQYIDALAYATQALFAANTVVKGARAMEKKYQYNTTRSVLVKQYKHSEVVENIFEQRE